MVHYLYVSECRYLFSIHESADAFRYDLRRENGEDVLKAIDVPSELLEQGDIADGYVWYDLVKPYIVG